MSPWSAELNVNDGEQRCFQFEIIINVLVSPFRFIWIPMLWVYSNYTYFYSYGAEFDFRRLKSIPAVSITTSVIKTCATRNVVLLEASQMYDNEHVLHSPPNLMLYRLDNMFMHCINKITYFIN